MHLPAKFTFAAAIGLILLTCGTAGAEPMKCSGEQKACFAICEKMKDGPPRRGCVNACHERLASCRTTGCWFDGTRTYCGLDRR